MIKFFLVSLIIWFIIIKLLKFKFIVLKGQQAGFNREEPKRNGSIRVDNSIGNKKGKVSNDKGEYVDYEEIK